MKRLLLVRTPALAFDVLEGLRGSEASRLAKRAIEADLALEAVASRLEGAWFAEAGPPEAATTPEQVALRNALLDRRRRVHRRKPLAPDEDADYARAHGEETRSRAAFELAWSLDLERGREEVVRLAGTPPMPLALRLVGKSLHAAVEKLGAKRTHGDRHRTAKIAAYLVRAATKTSPTGMFCATAVATADGDRVDVSGTPEIARVDALLSVAEARKVAAILARDPAIAAAIVPRLEPTLEREADAWTFWRAATPRDPEDVEVRSRVRAGDAVDVVLALVAEGGRALPEVVAEAARRLGVEVEEAAEFLDALVEAGAVVAEVGIPYAERRPLAYVLARARDAGIEPPWGTSVDALESKVAAVEIDAVVESLAAMPRVRPIAADEAVRIDAASGLVVKLPSAWIDAIRRDLRPYVRLFAAMYPERTYIDAAASRFLAKFPADVDVRALDAYHGVFEPGEARRPSAFPEPTGADVVRRVREFFAETALRDPSNPIELDDRGVDALVGPGDEPPWSCGVLFQVAGREGARFVLSSLYQGSGLALARFAHLHGHAVVDELRRAHAHLERDGTIVAEITYNHGGRTANAGLRPSLFDHEIELPGETATPGRTVLPLRELLVRWDSTTRRFVLRRERDGRKVVPVVNSGVNPTGIVSFLVDIGRQGEQPLGLFPGFDDPRVVAWPRVTSGSLTLLRRRWVLRPDAWPAGSGAAFFLGVQRLRERWALPRWVFASTPEDPKPRAFDFESPLLVEILERTLAPARDAAPSSLHVAEMDPGPDDLWIEGPGGRYASEFLVQLEHAGENG